MRPLALTLAGAALGLGAVLPIARTQFTDKPPPAVVEAVPDSGTKVVAVRVTATGPVVGTRYGPVQVRITLDGRRVTDVTAIQLPAGDERSRRISEDAGPRLKRAVILAQGATFDAVSGASYTSAGYRRSLQAALDMARVAAQRGRGA